MVNVTWAQVVLFGLSLTGLIVAQHYAPGVATQVATFAALALNFAMGRKNGQESLRPPKSDDDEVTDPGTPKSILGGKP